MKNLYNESCLEKYIELAVRSGVNVQPGQELLISCSVDCAFFARKAMESAFRAGAKDVHIHWTDDITSRTRFLNADDSVFDIYPEWSALMTNSLSGGGAAFLHISSEDPEALKGVSPDRLSRFNKAGMVAQKDHYERVMTGRVRWSVVSVPSVTWARKVFPDATSTDEAVSLLWENIFAASRVDGGDAVENWKAHSAAMQKRIDALNGFKFSSLHFKNGVGTDLTMKLPKNHVWMGGGDVDKDGFPFLPNIPTEEIFSAPDRAGVNGTLVGTMPNVFRGNLIDGFHMSFKDGKVTDYGARLGGEHLEKMITDTPHMDRLGEVALVPHDSPISNTGILFYNTLYDENASCHLALGSAYPDCVEGGGDMSEADREVAGINVCDNHHDFMFGSPDMDITGLTAAGEEVPVFRGGNFVI